MFVEIEIEKSENNNKMVENIFCCICLSEINEINEINENESDKNKENKENKVLKECDHVFHETCIKEWIKINETCPICRSKIIIKENSNNDLPIIAIPNNARNNNTYCSNESIGLALFIYLFLTFIISLIVSLAT